MASHTVRSLPRTKSRNEAYSSSAFVSQSAKCNRDDVKQDGIVKDTSVAVDEVEVRKKGARRLLRYNNNETESSESSTIERPRRRRRTVLVCNTV